MKEWSKEGEKEGKGRKWGREGESDPFQQQGPNIFMNLANSEIQATWIQGECPVPGFIWCYVDSWFNRGDEHS